VAWHFGDAQYTVETIADWYSPRSNSSLSIINNKLVSIADSTNTFGAAQQIDNLIVGNVYKMKARSTCNNAAATMFLSVSVDATLSPSVIFTQGTSTALIDNLFTATATTMYFGVVVSGHAANDTVTIDAGITVKEITNYTEANAASEIESSVEGNNAVEYKNIPQSARDLYSLEDDTWVGSDELVTNGDFATTDTSYWTTLNSSVTIAGNGLAAIDYSGNFTTLIRNFDAFEQGGVYKVSIAVDSISNGGFIVFLNDINFDNITAVGTYTYIITGDSDGRFQLASTSFTGSLSNISIKKIIEVVEQAAFSPVTAPMTLTEAWTTRGTAYSTLQNTTSASVRVDATISNTDDGILMESGASGIGSILYVYNGVLYFQCGNGSAYGTASNRAEVSYTLPVGESDYVIEWSADTSNAVLYINGLVVGSQAFSESLIAGSDAGTLGEVEGVAPVNRGGWTTDGAGVYTNTITKCDVFDNQITSDV